MIYKIKNLQLSTFLNLSHNHVPRTKYLVGTLYNVPDLAEDAGTYTCTATNNAGAVGTTATLQVPGERRSSYI